MIGDREVVVSKQSEPPCEACGADTHGAYRLGRNTWLCALDLEAALEGNTAKLAAAVQKAAEEEHDH